MTMFSLRHHENDLFLTKFNFQYAVKRANGERIAGRRIRVTVAKPRNRGPRNRYDRRY